MMLDIMLPDMDGIEISKRLRGSSATAKVVYGKHGADVFARASAAKRLEERFYR